MPLHVAVQVASSCRGEQSHAEQDGWLAGQHAYLRHTDWRRLLNVRKLVCTKVALLCSMQLRMCISVWTRDGPCTAPHLATAVDGLRCLQDEHCLLHAIIITTQTIGVIIIIITATTTSATIIAIVCISGSPASRHTLCHSARGPACLGSLCAACRCRCL